MICPIDYSDDTKFADLEVCDCVKVVTIDGNEFRGVVSCVTDGANDKVSGLKSSPGVIFISGGGIYWRDYGELIGHDSATCAICLDGKPQCGWPRIERAALEELDPLLDIGVLA